MKGLQVADLRGQLVCGLASGNAVANKLACSLDRDRHRNEQRIMDSALWRPSAA